MAELSRKVHVMQTPEEVDSMEYTTLLVADSVSETDRYDHLAIHNIIFQNNLLVCPLVCTVTYSGKATTLGNI